MSTLVCLLMVAPIRSEQSQPGHSEQMAFYFGKERFKILENFASSQRELKP
jgi:hypothetical protein